MNNSDRLQEIRERAEKATPGPWAPTDEELSDCRKADQYFIAEARSDIPWLLQLVTEQQRGIEEMTAARDTAVGHLQDALQDIADMRETKAQRLPQAREANLTPLQMVRQFHEAFGVPAYDTPRIPPPVRQTLRRSLIEEEWWKTYHALIGASVGTNDITEIADGLADLVVVIYGTALEYGIDLDAVLEEVHRSNMSKLGADGRPIYREDGKVLKGPNYQPPNIAAVLGI